MLCTITARFQDPNQPAVTTRVMHTVANDEAVRLANQFAALKSVTIANASGYQSVYAPVPHRGSDVSLRFLFTVPPVK